MHYLGSTVDDVGSTSQQLRDHPDISSFCRTNECGNLFHIQEKRRNIAAQKAYRGVNPNLLCQIF